MADDGLPQSARRPTTSTLRVVAVSVVGVVAMLAQFAIGVYYVLIFVTTADDPSRTWLLTICKLVLGAGYVAIFVGLFWAWSKRSFLVVAAPIAAWGLVWVGAYLIDRIVPMHLNWGY